jgi:hypothetical protein
MAEAAKGRKQFVVKLKKEGKGDRAFYPMCGRLFLGDKSGTLVWNDRLTEYAVFPDEEKEKTEDEGAKSPSGRLTYVIKLKKEGKGDRSFYAMCGRIFLGEKSGTLVWNDRLEEYAVFPDEEKEKAE